MVLDLKPWFETGNPPLNQTNRREAEDGSVSKLVSLELVPKLVCLKVEANGRNTSCHRENVRKATELDVVRFFGVHVYWCWRFPILGYTWLETSFATLTPAGDTKPYPSSRVFLA